MEEIATYDYTDEAGALLFQAVRMEPKNFRQRHRSGNGEWAWNLNGCRRVLYRLPDVRTAVEAGRVIFIVEGEKDADRLAAEGLVATCNPMGAGSWMPEYDNNLKGAQRVIVVPDNDAAGRDHADAVTASLLAAGIPDVRVLKLPGLSETGDVSDWFEVGNSIAEFKRLAGEARKAEPAPAKTESTAAEFTPLGLARGEPLPFPLPSLPDVIREAVAEYQRYGQQPVALVASSALAAASFACQGLADVARDEQLIGPISLALFPVAESGERKTAADRAFSTGMDEWVREREAEHSAEMLTYQREHDRWTVRMDDAKQRYRRSLKTGGVDAEAAESVLAAVQAEEPAPPVGPPARFSDATSQAIVKHLGDAYPIGALWDDEAGNVIGAIGMHNEAILGFLSTVNKLWDGRPLKSHRASTDNRSASGKRVTVNLMMQATVLETLVSARRGAAREVGFMARALLCCPQSTMGHRPYADPGDTSASRTFHRRVRTCLETPLTLAEGSRVELAPPVLSLSPEAQRAWVKYLNDVEVEIAEGGEFEAVKDAAAKSAENAARLAALFHLFSGHPVTEPVSVEHMDGGIRVAAWYLDEARRVLGGYSVPERIRDARALFDWIMNADDHAKAHDGRRAVNLRTISHRGPNRVRLKDARDAALRVLVEHGYITLVQEGRQRLAVVSPDAAAEAKL